MFYINPSLVLYNLLGGALMGFLFNIFKPLNEAASNK
jgi:hypothetical protein